MSARINDRLRRLTSEITSEPGVGALVAYAWLGEELSSLQITGGATVLAGIPYCTKCP